MNYKLLIALMSLAILGLVSLQAEAGILGGSYDYEFCMQNYERSACKACCKKRGGTATSDLRKDADGKFYEVCFCKTKKEKRERDY